DTGRRPPPGELSEAAERRLLPSPRARLEPLLVPARPTARAPRRPRAPPGPRRAWVCRACRSRQSPTRLYRKSTYHAPSPIRSPRPSSRTTVTSCSSCPWYEVRSGSRELVIGNVVLVVLYVSWSIR